LVVRAMPVFASRFYRLPAWQRAAMLALTILVICLVLLLLAELGTCIRNKVRHGDLWGIEQTYTLDPTRAADPDLRRPLWPIAINSVGSAAPKLPRPNVPAA
jgi:hypothetical protein